MSSPHRLTLLAFCLSVTVISCTPSATPVAKAEEPPVVEPTSLVQPVYGSDNRDEYEKVTTFADGKQTRERVDIDGNPIPEPKYKFERPAVVKGVYLTAWSAGRKEKMDNILAMLDKTELNSVVIDIRDSGEMYWKTGIETADASGATKVAVQNPEELFTRLEKHKVWPIARIACFRDQFVPRSMPQRAVQRAGGGVWRDRSGHAWLDPYNKKNWEYIAQAVDFAMETGFMDIQLDYVRFPSEGNASSQRFPAKKDYPGKNATPSGVIQDFCQYIRDRVKKRGLEFSADIFGIISSGKGDQGIGQTLEQVAEPFDVISPMVYPSHYARGEYGVANPNAQPYAIIKASLADYKKRVPNAKVRPWLQDFSLGHRYGVKEVQAQIRAMRELGYKEFLLWNAGNRYTWSAMATEAKLRTASKPSPKPSAKVATVSAKAEGTQ